MTDPATMALIYELEALLQTARNELDAHADSLARLDAELRSAALYAQDLEGTFDAFATVLRNIDANLRLTAGIDRVPRPKGAISNPTPPTCD